VAESKNIRRWPLLGLLIVVICWGAWTLVHRYRESTWSDAYEKAALAYSSQNYTKAEEILVPLLARAERWWPGGPYLFRTVLLLGESYREDHKHNQAEPLLERALELSSIVPSIESTDIGRIKLNLGVIARDSSNDAKAEQLFSEALEIFQKNPPAAQGDDASSMLNLGFLCNKQGRYSDAESFLNRAITRYQQLLGAAPHGLLANAHFALAEAYLKESRFADAADQYHMALSMYEKVEGLNGLDVAHVLQGLSVVEGAQGKTREAREVLERSRNIEQHLEGTASNPDGATLNNFGLIADREGRYAEAESFFKRSVDAYEKAVGPDHPDLAIALANLGRLYRDREQFDIAKAEPLLIRALSIREKTLGHDHPDTVKTLSDLSLLYFYQKNFAAAEEFAARALPIQEKAFGKDGLDVSTTLNRLGISERDLGKFPEAEATLKRALAIREKVLAPNHSWIAVSLENLASVYAAQGRYDKVTPLLTRARAIRAHPSGG
jgi:tetratricopeptide (TPR) repeat protein